MSERTWKWNSVQRIEGNTQIFCNVIAKGFRGHLESLYEGSLSDSVRDR
jgi:hypothetical protein